MTTNAWFQIVLYFVVLLALTKPLGLYMARVYEGQPVGLDRLLGPVERLIYRLCGVRPDEQMGWERYAIAMLAFEAVAIMLLIGLLRRSGSPVDQVLIYAWHPLTVWEIAGRGKVR